MESTGTTARQYAECQPKGQKRKERVRFKDPSPATDDEDTPLLLNSDVEMGRQRRRSVKDYEEKNSYLRGSVKHLILRNLLLITLACILIVGTAVVCIKDLVNRYIASPMSLCTTPGCVLAAAELIRDMSPNYDQIDPCQDFHRFTCEGFGRTHSIRPDQVSIQTLSIMSETAQAVLRQVLESPYAQESSRHFAELENFQKLQTAYNSCMNETAIKEKGNTPLLDLLAKLEDIYQAQGANDLTAGIDYLLTLGEDAVLDIGVEADDKNPEQQIIQIVSPGLGLLSKEYYRDEKQLELYKRTITPVFESLAADKKSRSCSFSNLCDNLTSFSKESSVDSLIKFESKIAAASPNPEDASDPTFAYNPLNQTEVENLLPQISISTLVEKRVPKYLPEGKFIVQSPAYLRSLSEILNQTSSETIEHYLQWKLIVGYYSRIESEAVRPLYEFYNLLRGKDVASRPERWRTCIGHVDSGLGWILSHHYIKESFSQDSKDFGDQVIQDIKDRLANKLQNSEWMSKDVREMAIEKVNSIRQKIGYPANSPNIQDAQELKERYAGVKITEGGYFSNQLSMMNTSIVRQWAKAGKPTDKDEWLMTASTVNAYYNPPLGEVVFPAAIMQRPTFYNPVIPQYLSYGAFGSVAGHELSHAFDSTGRHYDMNGRFSDWWDNKTVEAFQEKADCFVQQYHNYTVPNPKGAPIHLNGKLTLGENIADAGGASAAFHAWKIREAENPGPILPGLMNFTKEQLFFISYANTWCGMVRPEEVRNRVYIDPHSPIDLRIKGTMENSREFREAFNCPVKEPTCELW